MLTLQLVQTNKPRTVRMQMHCGNVFECQLAGDVDNAVRNVMEKKNTPLVLKLKGMRKTTYINTEDICHIEVMDV